MDSRVIHLPDHVLMRGRMDVPVSQPVSAIWFKEGDEDERVPLNYKVAEYVNRAGEWEFERWKQ